MVILGVTTRTIVTIKLYFIFKAYYGIQELHEALQSLVDLYRIFAKFEVLSQKIAGAEAKLENRSKFDIGLDLD